MLYVPFLAEKNGYKNSQQGDHKCASGGGGGQRSMVKDHKMTIFFGALPLFRYSFSYSLGDSFSQLLNTSLRGGVTKKNTEQFGIPPPPTLGLPGADIFLVSKST